MFDASRVRLLSGSPFYERQELHRNGYVGGLEVSKLLFPYRTLANLPQPPGQKGYEGWDGGFIRGHMAGHYLSAASRMYAATGDTGFLDKVNLMVAGLAECQNALGTGHLAAFPETVLDHFEGKKGEKHGIAVPYYTIHKVMAGLLDAYHYTGNKQALEMAVKMSDRYAARMAALPPESVEKLLRTDGRRNPLNEFGGMSDALTELAADTGDTRHLKLARIFNRDWLIDPLAADEDRLVDLHANTHIAQVVGIAHYANATGDQTHAKAARNFWKLVTGTRSFVIGGNSFKECFDKPNVEVGRCLTGGIPLPYNTAETCNTHNMLKLTRYLFEQEPQAGYADFSERALYNHILSSIAPDTGRVTYFHPLGGQFKTYLPGTECCVGTGIENTGRYGEGIYFGHGDTLWVNLYIPSELDWREKGIVLRQEGNIPYVPGVRLTVVKAAAGSNAKIMLRIPAWVSGPVHLTVNGEAVETTAISPSSYVQLSRAWKAGDKIELALPASLRLERAKDVKEMVSILYGPLVLAARLGKEGMPNDFAPANTYKDLPPAPVPAIESASTDPARWLRLSDPATLTFEAHDCGPASGLRFQPLNAVHHERYTVYLPLLAPGQSLPQTPTATAQTARSATSPDPSLVDRVTPGVPPSEKAHDLAAEHSHSGNGPQGRLWRDAEADGWFAYALAIVPDQPLNLVCTYWGGDKDRAFDISANGEQVATQTLNASHPGQYFEVNYPLPAKALSGQQNINVRFQGIGKGRAGGVFDVKILKRP